MLFQTMPYIRQMHEVLTVVIPRVQNDITRGGFRHVQHVWPNRGAHKKGAPTRGQYIFEICRKII